MPPLLPIKERLLTLKQRIALAQEGAPLAAPRVSLIAISKFQPADKMEEALLAGQREFGENRVQEAEEKWPALKARYPDIILHLVGPLQTNKVKDALALFDVIHTLDRPKLADAMKKELGERKKEFLIQINTGEEPQKAGIAPQEADGFIDYCIKDLGLPVVGLMCIPPANEPPAPHFALLRTLAERHGLKRLSMGMSGDFETAIRFGATEVRIGTALFGERA